MGGWIMAAAFPVGFPRVPQQVPEEVMRAVVFANLQEFSQRVGMICALQASGHLSPTAAYAHVQALWQELRHASQSLESQE